MKRKSIHSIAFDNMTFGYPGAPPLFENLSIDLPKARAVWVRSPGGRGKSTLLRLLMGLMAPQKGSLMINGENASNLPFEEFLAYRLSMGYGFDMGGLLNNKTIFENLILPLHYHRVISAEDAVLRVTEAIGMFGMAGYKDLRPFAVPGSVRKLACIVRAFLHWPQIVFLDDPLIGLKEDNINDLISHTDESFARRGLKQVIFTSESPRLAHELKAEELLVSTDWCATRAVAS